MLELCAVCVYTTCDVQEGQLKVLAENDPSKLTEMNELLPWMKIQANRWIDNVNMCQQWLKDNGDPEQVAHAWKELKIPMDLDTID